MSDPIADIIHSYRRTYSRPDVLAKQIRQQIGRELLEHLFIVEYEMDDPSVTEEDIRKICQLEEDNEKG